MHVSGTAPQVDRTCENQTMEYVMCRPTLATARQSRAHSKYHAYQVIVSLISLTYHRNLHPFHTTFKAKQLLRRQIYLGGDQRADQALLDLDLAENDFEFMNSEVVVEISVDLGKFVDRS